ncbi:MAG: ABC transporter permease subunit [Desulfatiglandales bacterium]
MALSEDKMASIVLGINPQKIYILVFWSSLLLTIFSGIILSFITPIQPHWALMLTIKSLLIISLSRRFKLLDIFFISIFLGISETFANFYLGQELKTILIYSMFILVTKLGQDILVKYHEEV